MFNPQAKLLCHSGRVWRWYRTGRTAPVLVEIAPTGYCNATCPWCFFNGKKSKTRINRKTMLSAIEDMATMGVKALNWSGGGEPTLHPDFAEFVARAQGLGLKQGLFTNGYTKIPNQRSFSWIRISLTEKGFKKIKIPDVPFGICVNQIKDHTMKQLIGYYLTASKIGASYFQIRPALMGSYKKQPYLCIPTYLKDYETKTCKIFLTEYKYDEAMRDKKYKDCYGYHFCPSISWTGKLSICLYLSLNKQYILGDLGKESFQSIWWRIPEKIKVTDECQNCCKNNEINKMLYAVKHIKDPDFI